MVFSSALFIFVFLPITVIGYYLLNPKFRNIFLLIVSLAFYAWGEPKFVFVLIASIFMNYIYALLVDHFRKRKLIARTILTLMVTSNVAIFFIYKYLDFAITNINWFFRSNIELRNIALPIGISFFTFQAMSYVIDVYRKDGEVQKNPLNVALYICFFPQLIAGPIVRYETVAKEINHRKETFRDFSSGMSRFIVGLAKKAIIANSMAMVADYAFNMTDYHELSIALAWLGSICYTLQIYFDFSGYSDMAIGLGCMFGFHFSENFNYPYTASSITDFWRRWHISLSSWFRDYVYIPLGGSRTTKIKTFRNIFVVWLLTGIWHGASWNFICWGMFYFVLLVVEKQTKIIQRLHTKLGKALYRVFTLVAVNFGWVLFRAADIKQAGVYIASMFGGYANELWNAQTIIIYKDILVTLIIAIIASTPIIKWIYGKIRNKKINSVYEVIRGVCIVALFVLSIGYSLNSSYNPFIYFNF